MNNWTTNPPEEEALYWVTVGSSVLLCNWRADKQFHLYGSTKAKVRWDQRSIDQVVPPNAE